VDFPRRDGLLQALAMLLGSLALLRAGAPAPWVWGLRGLAIATATLALVAPRRLATAHRAVGRGVTVALLAVVYAAVLLPVRALLILLRVDPWAVPRGADSHWIERDAAQSANDFRGMS
jgi:hypothetical protein